MTPKGVSMKLYYLFEVNENSVDKLKYNYLIARKLLNKIYRASIC